MHTHRDGTVGHGSEVPSFPAVLSKCLAAGILVLDAQGRITVCTPAAGTRLGMTASALLQQPSSILPPALRRAIEEQAGGNPVEMKLGTALGETTVQVTTT